jgi:zinc protease
MCFHQAKVWLGLCVGLLLIPAAHGPGQAPQKTETKAAVAAASSLDLPPLKYEQYKLPNGLDVILSEDHRLPLVAVNIWYHVGPAYELPDRTGFAHLFEHMMFEGSKHVPGNEHIRYLEAAGATDVNGTTSFDRTNYFETLPSNQLELALWLESDRMGYLPDQLDQTNLANQQDVVRNERRQSHESVPYGIVQEAVFHQLFPKNHPYYGDVIGSHADIQAAKLGDVRDFFKLYYAPNNASLVIVGDFESNHAKELIEKYFGPLKRGGEIPKINVKTPPITSERRAVVQDKVQLPRVYMAWLTSPFFKPGDAEADLAAEVMAGGKSSRMYKRLVYDKQIALDVNAYQQSMMLCSIFQITATAREGHTPQELEKAINEELDAFRKDGPTATELMRARNGIETGRIEGLEPFGGFADLLNAYNDYVGTPNYLAADLGRYEEATQDSVKAFADIQLKPNARVVVYGVPGAPDLGPEVPTPKTEKTGPAQGSGEPVNEDARWRAEPPKAGPLRPWHPPAPEEFKLANGLTVLLNERPGLPIVAADVVVRAGSGANPADRPGLASLTASMLQQGTATRNALQIADRAADLGTAVHTGASTDLSSASIGSLTRNFADAVDLLADVVLHPNFPAAEIERQRAQRLAQLMQERSNSRALASRAMLAALYGPKNPYGYPDVGTQESLKAMTREDLLHFWQQSYIPNDAALIVTGNINKTTLKQLMEKAFGGWPQGKLVTASMPAPETTPARLVLVNLSGTPQSALRVFSLGAARSTPDYAALEVMNTELGGLFSSRINLNLREQHGFTYGAGSIFRCYRYPGPFIVYSQVRTDVTTPAITEMFKELRRMQETPMTAEELSLSKDYIARGLPGRFETGAEAAGSFAEIYVYDLPVDYFSTLPEKVSAVTAGQAQEAAKKYINPDKAIVLVVGDRAKVEPDLLKLDLKPVEVRDADGNVAK